MSQPGGAPLLGTYLRRDSSLIIIIRVWTRGTTPLHPSVADRGCEPFPRLMTRVRRLTRGRLEMLRCGRSLRSVHRPPLGTRRLSTSAANRAHAAGRPSSTVDQPSCTVTLAGRGLERATISTDASAIPIDERADRRAAAPAADRSTTVAPSSPRETSVRPGSNGIDVDLVRCSVEHPGQPRFSSTFGAR